VSAGAELTAAAVRAQLPELLEALQAAAEAAARSEPTRSSKLCARLDRHPFDLVSVTAALLIARQIPTRPAALLLGVQAETAPAATSLTRAAGQLFLLAGERFWRRDTPDAPLSALQALAREAGTLPVLTGAVWALATLLRMPTGVQT
jgi:hypothetical protein